MRQWILKKTFWLDDIDCQFDMDFHSITLAFVTLFMVIYTSSLWLSRTGIRKLKTQNLLELFYLCIFFS